MTLSDSADQFGYKYRRPTSVTSFSVHLANIELLLYNIWKHENVSARQSRSYADRKEEERCYDTTERFKQVHGVFTKEVSWLIIAFYLIVYIH